MIPEIGIMIQRKVRKKKMTCFNAHFQYSQSKITDTVIKVYILRIRCGQSLAKLKCEIRTSLHAVQCK